jgi:hypothetical protein
LVYDNIAYVYTQEYKKATADYDAKCIKATCSDEEDQKSKAQLRGIADRVLESNARALTIAKAKNLPAATITRFTETAKTAYKARFDSDAGFDAYIKGVTTKPLSDPATPIAPIEVAPTTSATPGTTTTATPGAATTTTVPKPTDAARPRTTGNNGAATTTKPAATTTTKPAVKPAAKPAPKKPGS